MPKLFMLLLGCKPSGRHTEQHDVFFGIGDTAKDLVTQIKKFWPEASGKLHVDAWREVTKVDGYQIIVSPKGSQHESSEPLQLFFINLGGYQPKIFDEPHFKVLTVQKDMGDAIQHAKTTSFFREIHFSDAHSHVDDKYGIDVDDIFEVGDILPSNQKAEYQLTIVRQESAEEDEIHLGYFKLDKLP